MNGVKLPVITLKYTYFDSNTCNLNIHYTGKLSLADIELRVNNTSINTAQVGAWEAAFKPDKRLLKEAFERRKPLPVEVNATLSNISILIDKYSAIISGVDPELITIDNKTTLVKIPTIYQ